MAFVYSPTLCMLNFHPVYLPITHLTPKGLYRLRKWSKRRAITPKRAPWSRFVILLLGNVRKYKIQIYFVTYSLYTLCMVNLPVTYSIGFPSQFAINSIQINFLIIQFCMKLNACLKMYFNLQIM